jgi:phosphomannomutase
MHSRANTVVLFDVDGTLTAPRKKVLPQVLEALKNLREKVTIGFVGGSDLGKQKEQLGENGKVSILILCICLYV